MKVHADPLTVFAQHNLLRVQTNQRIWKRSNACQALYISKLISCNIICVKLIQILESKGPHEPLNHNSCVFRYIYKKKIVWQKTTLLHGMTEHRPMLLWKKKCWLSCMDNNW